MFNLIAKWNSRPKPSAEIINRLQEHVCAEEKTKSESHGKLKEFRDAFLLRQICILSLSWFASSVTYYGISFNMKNMSGNRYLNVGLLGAFDLPAELSGIYFSNRWEVDKKKRRELSPFRTFFKFQLIFFL